MAQMRESESAFLVERAGRINLLRHSGESHGEQILAESRLDRVSGLSILRLVRYGSEWSQRRCTEGKFCNKATVLRFVSHTSHGFGLLGVTRAIQKLDDAFIDRP
jgi:hypothetical protein